MEGKSTPETETNIHPCPECDVDFETTERFREHFFDEHLITTPEDTSVAEGSSQTAPQHTEPDDTEPDDTEPDDTEPDDTEPDDTEPVDPESGEKESDDSEPGNLEPGDPEPSNLEPGDPEPSVPRPDDSSRADNDPTPTADSSAAQQAHSAPDITTEPSLPATPAGANPIRSDDVSDVKRTVHGSESLETPQSLDRRPSRGTGRTVPLEAIRKTGRSLRRGHVADILLALMALILAGIVGSVLLVVILELVR